MSMNHYIYAAHTPTKAASSSFRTVLLSIMMVDPWPVNREDAKPQPHIIFQFGISVNPLLHCQSEKEHL